MYNVLFGSPIRIFQTFSEHFPKMPSDVMRNNI